MDTQKDTHKSRNIIDFRNWRISTKLLVVMLILTLIPLIIVTYIGVQTGAEAMTREEKINHSRLANSTAQRIEQLLSGNHSFISVTSRQPSVIAFLSAPTANLAVENEPEVYAAIDRLLESNSTIDLVSLFDAKGTVVAHNRPEFIGLDYLFRDFVKAALIDQEQYTTGIQIGWTSDEPGINASAPVYQEGTEKALVGAMSTRIKGAYIEEMLRSGLEFDSDEISETERKVMEIFLINEYGIIMSHSHESHFDGYYNWLYRSLGEIPEEQMQEIIDVRLLGGECTDIDCKNKDVRIPKPIPALQPLGDTLLTAMAESKTGSYYYCRPNPDSLDVPAPSNPEDCSNGEWHVVGYAPVRNPNNESNLFMVVVDVPESVFLQQITQFRDQGLMVAAIVGVIALLVALIVARTMAKPIGKLAQVAQDVENDLPFEPENIADVMSLGDEVGDLARVFSAMVLALRARMADLQTIYEIGQEISSSVDLEETLHFILAAIDRVIPYDSAELCFYNSENDTMIVRAAGNATGYYCFQTETANFYTLDEGYISYLSKTGTSLLVADIEAYTEHQIHPTRKWNDIQPRSYLGVALRIKDQVIGTIELTSKAPNHFTADNLRLLESIAVQAAIEVQNAQEVLEREQRLAHQIQQMDININHEKQAEQVDSIVTSDFFKMVQRKGQKNRQGKQEE